MSNIEESILSRVKSELGLVGEIDNEKLLKMLSAARVAKHPDKYTDEGAKKKAEEDFKRMDKATGCRFNYLNIRPPRECRLTETALNYTYRPFNGLFSFLPHKDSAYNYN